MSVVKQYRVGFLGTGYIADWHAQALRAVEGAKLVAVCDQNLARAEAFAASHGVKAKYRDLDSMLAGEKLDVVHVLLPPSAHHPAAVAILNAGVHAFIEKPMCTNVADAQAIVDLAAAKGLQAGVNHNFLFSPIYEQLKSDLTMGKVGRIDSITLTWNKELGQIAAGPYDTWLFRDPRHVLLEIGPHPVGQLLDLIGTPETLRVEASNPIHLPGGRTFYRRWVATGLKEKTSFELLFSFVPGFAEHTLHVRGSLAAATADFERNTYLLHHHTRYNDDFDRCCQLIARGSSLAWQGGRNFVRYGLGKFKLSRKGNAFGYSIARSLQSFYQVLPHCGDARGSAAFGAKVIGTCVAMGEAAGISATKVDVPAATPSVGHAQAQPAEVLIFGATGFIGREVVRQLLAAGRSVRLLVRSRGRLPDAFIDPRVEIMTGDTANADDVDKALAGMKSVIHLARADVKTWGEYYKQDVMVTRRIAEQCLAHHVQRLVYTGTISSYYAGRKAGTITEKTPLDDSRRRILYSRAKTMSEHLLMGLHHHKQLPVVIVRPGIVMGSGGSPFHGGVGNFQRNAVVQLFGKGNNKLPTVLVEDVAAGIIAAMDTPGIEGESFNLVGDPMLSARQYLDELDRFARIRLTRIPTPIYRFYMTEMGKWIIKMMVRHHNRIMPSYADWDSRTQNAYFNCDKAKRMLNWRPTDEREVLIDKGIRVPVEEFNV